MRKRRRDAAFSSSSPRSAFDGSSIREQSVDIHSAGFAIGLVAVVWLSVRRFDTPREVRTYTRATLHFWGSVAYALAGVALYVPTYFLLARALDLGEASALGALLAMGLAVRLPGASWVDCRLRAELQRLIGYPSEAHRLASALAVAPFVPADAVRDELRFVLEGRGYDLDNGWLPVAEPMRALWFRAAALFQQVQRWDRDRRFAGFASAARDELDMLRQRFDQLSLKVVRVLDTIEELGRLWIRADAKPDPSDGAPQQSRTELRAIVSRLLADLREDIAFFYRNLCLFVARGILARCAWARGRHRELAKLGFELPRERSRTMLLLLVPLVFVFYFVAFLLVVSGTVDSLAEAVPRIAKIALIQALAVAIAVVPKQLFGFANERLSGRTPWGFVLSAGVGAVLVAVLVQFAFAAVAVNGANGAGGLWRIAPWLPMPFAAAASIAYLVQDGRWAGVDSAIGRRFADVLVLICTLGLALCAARWIQYLANGRVWELETVVRDARLIAIIALGIGYMIPNAFRHPPARAATRPPARAHPSPAPDPRGRTRSSVPTRLTVVPRAAGRTRNVSAL
jgi:hypothetical protein